MKSKSDQPMVVVRMLFVVVFFVLLTGLLISSSTKKRNYVDQEIYISATNSQFIALVERGTFGNDEYKLFRDKRTGAEFFHYNNSMIVIPPTNRNILLFTKESARE